MRRAAEAGNCRPRRRQGSQSGGFLAARAQAASRRDVVGDFLADRGGLRRLLSVRRCQSHDIIVRRSGAGALGCAGGSSQPNRRPARSRARDGSPGRRATGGGPESCAAAAARSEIWRTERRFPHHAGCSPAHARSRPRAQQHAAAESPPSGWRFLSRAQYQWRDIVDTRWRSIGIDPRRRFARLRRQGWRRGRGTVSQSAGRRRPPGAWMSIRPYRDIVRRKSRTIHVGSVAVGGDAPISVQSMTNTLTSDARATIEQIKRLEDAGADIVRVSCPDEESTAALRTIVNASRVPIVADIHFHYKRAIEAAKAGAACLRINPGNIGSKERVKEVVKAAKDHGCSMRIGVNAGSLERDLLEQFGEPCPEAMVESALRHMRLLEENDFFEFKVSVKASDVFLAVAAYQQLADICDYPLHLGITEAGGMIPGTVKSSIGMGMLLWSGIGDTIRVSLSAETEEEIRVGFDLLKSLVLRHRGVNIGSCPSF